MADFSSLTSKFRAHKFTSQPAIQKAAKRPQLVCKQCQKSKLRCDRGQPCSNCVKRGEINCSYHGDVTTKPAASRNTVAEERLLHLESMVRQLMETQSDAHVQNTTAPPESLKPPNQSIESHGSTEGQQRESPAQIETGYVGSTHWSAILDDIHDLKSVLGDSVTYQHNQNPAPSEHPALDQELIYGLREAYSLSNIIAHVLPPKVETDRYLATYFQAESFISPFLHTYHFQRQYAEFWKDTSKVNPLWLSILFSICSMSSSTQTAMSSPKSSQDCRIGAATDFHVAAGQCLVLGEYHRPQPFVIEALTLYGHYIGFRSLDPSREVGTLLGIALRLAYEMGLHRDPDVLGTFTAFEGEMRRRLWSSCKQLDLMVSFQLGLPSSICLEECDTKSPRNLLDSDFDERTEVLPESRAQTEPTRLMWYIVKERQMLGFSKVCQAALSCREKTPEEIAEIDKEIRAMHTTVPEAFRARPLSESIADAPFFIMTRVFIEFIYLKSICVLHRKHMVRGDGFSTRCCTEAGMKLVSQFIDVYKEFAPGGQLHSVRWMLRTFTMTDFLLAVMVLCLVVHTGRKSDPQSSGIDAGTEKELLELLERSYDICIEKSGESRDARRVSKAVRIILNGLSAPSSQSTIPARDSTSPVTISDGKLTAVEEWNLDRQDVFSYPWQSYLIDGQDAFGLLDAFQLPENVNDDQWTMPESLS